MYADASKGDGVARMSGINQIESEIINKRMTTNKAHACFPNIIYIDIFFWFFSLMLWMEGGITSVYSD